ncbi:hypothetical protein AX769_14865 [Frondihabitans sp. PAMC 28766]|nr:hypothetical protein AX769_14865 [Frondihabitans sp. PAMC 28766]
MNRARATRPRPAIWSPTGCDPLPEPDACERRGSGPQPHLAAQAIHEACRRPLGTIIVHTVAERLAAFTGPQDLDDLLAEVRIESPIGRLRLHELGQWLFRYGTCLSQVQAGLALLDGDPISLQPVFR